MTLLALARQGDGVALDQLLRRYLPRMQRWASGRLPAHVRGVLETSDLVQDVIAHTVRRLDTFEPRHDAALEVYLREALHNRIRDELRRSVRRPAPLPISDQVPSREPSPLEQAIGTQALERYEDALAQLNEVERRAVIARIELGHSYKIIAESLGKPTADAARMAVERALVRLAELMRDGS